MRRAACLAILLLLVLLMAGCTAMLDFNLFKDLGLDKATAPTPADYAGAGGLDQLAADLSSPAIIDALKADPAAAAALEAYLQGLIGGGVSTPEQQQAAILLADLDLKTTNGEEFVNNIVTLLMAPYDPSVRILDLLQSIIPAEVANNQDAFSAMLEGLLTANGAYFALGQSIDALDNATGLPPADGLVDAGASLPPGVNAGDIAQKAAVAFIAEAIVSEVASAIGGTASQAIEQMYYLLYDQSNAAFTLDADQTMPDPFSAPSAGLRAMEALYNAAGMTIPT